jgi:hypothetical protein
MEKVAEFFNKIMRQPFIFIGRAAGAGVARERI